MHALRISCVHLMVWITPSFRLCCSSMSLTEVVRQWHAMFEKRIDSLLDAKSMSSVVALTDYPYTWWINGCHLISVTFKCFRKTFNFHNRAISDSHGSVSAPVYLYWREDMIWRSCSVLFIHAPTSLYAILKQCLKSGKTMFPLHDLTSGILLSLPKLRINQIMGISQPTGAIGCQIINF